MDDLDIENAITTLNIIYFNKCVTEQNMTQSILEDAVIEKFKVSRQQAKHFIFCAALYYHNCSNNPNCMSYIISYIQNNLYER